VQKKQNYGTAAPRGLTYRWHTVKQCAKLIHYVKLPANATWDENGSGDGLSDFNEPTARACICVLSKATIRPPIGSAACDRDF